jgi:hypothetical protein
MDTDFLYPRKSVSTDPMLKMLCLQIGAEIT